MPQRSLTETASSGILTGELTHVSRRRSTGGPFYTALLSASSTSAHSRGGGKKEEEEEISAIKGSQHCSIEILYNPRVQPQSREMWLNKNLFGPPYLLAFGMVCLNICLCLKTKETKTTSKQHGLLSSVQEWVKS